MNKRIFKLKMTILPVRNSISRSPLRRGFVLIPLAFACFALAPASRAVSPAPDGGYASGNTAEGTSALFSLTTGTWNTGLGFSTLFFNATGSFNTAAGSRALFNNTTGKFNTATGSQALYNNTSASDNTATGFEALFSNTTGIRNTANGEAALFSNTTGFGNMATGFEALFSNTTGNSNTANGLEALFSNTTGNSNTANGKDALAENTTGNDNTATGLQALVDNSTGSENTANGYQALFFNATGSQNTANGYQALFFNATGSQNTANGFSALLNNTGSNNIGLGSNAGSNLTTGSNNIDIGALGTAGESNIIRIGTVGTHTKAFVAGISVSAITGTAVVVNSNGRLGVASSSARFKDQIKPMDKASEAVLALRPVTFCYKPEVDPDGIPQFGLVAEEVEKVNPALVARDAQGKPYTVRYEAVNAMLLNEFLKQHRKVQEQEATIAKQQKQIEALGAGLQKVSAQVEMSRPTPQLVGNNQ